MANETSGRRDNRVPFRASTKTPNIMMLRRTRLLLIVCGILAFAVLGIKLFSVMIIHHDEYEKMAIDQQVRETEITASRGAIYDTNGKILAMNASVDTIFISPAEIAKNNEDPQLIARELSEILDVDYDKILSMTKNTDRWYEVVKRKVEPDVSEKVRAFKKEKKLVGVKIEPDTKRYYPYGSLAAHVIGFVGQDNEGRYGLEQRYDSYLTGSTGRIIRATDNRGTDMIFVNYEDYYDETKGNDMNLTIDATIQYYLEKHLQQAVEDYDVQNGAAAIAMDPSTGAILGMVSLGNFDLNNYQKVSDKDQEAIDAETDPDKRSELLTAAQQKQWRNKALSDTYEPGSTLLRRQHPRARPYRSGQVLEDGRPRQPDAHAGHAALVQRGARADRSACRCAHVLQIRRSVRLPESDQQRRQQPHRQDRHRPVRRERQHLVEPEHVL